VVRETVLEPDLVAVLSVLCDQGRLDDSDGDDRGGQSSYREPARKRHLAG
jgi:hypothetical protein